MMKKRKETKTKSKNNKISEKKERRIARSKIRYTFYSEWDGAVISIRKALVHTVVPKRRSGVGDESALRKAFIRIDNPLLKVFRSPVRYSTSR